MNQALQNAAGTFFLIQLHNALSAFWTVGGAGAARLLAFAFASGASCAGTLAVSRLGTFGAGAVQAEFAMVGAVTIGGACGINWAFGFFITTTSGGKTSGKNENE